MFQEEKPPPPVKRKPRVEIITTSESDSDSDSSDYSGMTEKEKRELKDMKMALTLQQQEIEMGHSMYDMVRRRRSKDAEKEENDRKLAQIKRQLDELKMKVIFQRKFNLFTNVTKNPLTSKNKFEHC